jgi:hypothetical protein
VAHDERPLHHGERVGHAARVHVGEIDDHAEALHLGHELDAELRQPAIVELRDGHRVRRLGGLEVHEAEHAEAAIVGGAEVIEAPLDALRALHPGEPAETSLGEGAAHVAPALAEREALGVLGRCGGEEVERREGLVDAAALLPPRQELQREHELRAHRARVDHEPEHRGVEAAALCARKVEVPGERRGGEPVAVLHGDVIVEEPHPQKSVDVQIEHEALAMEVEHVVGHGRRVRRRGASRRHGGETGGGERRAGAGAEQIAARDHALHANQ